MKGAGWILIRATEPDSKSSIPTAALQDLLYRESKTRICPLPCLEFLLTNNEQTIRFVSYKSITERGKINTNRLSVVL